MVGPARNESSLSIDDVVLSKGPEYVELDVRLRNANGGVVNLTRADVEVLERTPLAAAYKPSASYELLIEDWHSSVPIAQVLQPDEVDRFVLRLGFADAYSSCHITMRLRLYYNGDLQVTSAKFSFDSCFA